MKRYTSLLLTVLAIIPLQAQAAASDCLKGKIAAYFDEEKILQKRPLDKITSYPDATQKAVTRAVEYTLADDELRQAIWNVILNGPDDLLPKDRAVREVASLYIEQYTDQYALEIGQKSGKYPLPLYRAKGPYADLFMKDTGVVTALAKYNQLIDQRRKQSATESAEMQKAAQVVYNKDYMDQISESPEFKNTFEIGRKTVAELGCGNKDNE